MTIKRRSFIIGIGSALFAAPAIVRASSLDLVRGVKMWMEPDLAKVLADYVPLSSKETYCYRVTNLKPGVAQLDVLFVDPTYVESDWEPAVNTPVAQVEGLRQDYYWDVNHCERIARTHKRGEIVSAQLFKYPENLGGLVREGGLAGGSILGRTHEPQPLIKPEQLRSKPLVQVEAYGKVHFYDY